MLFALLVGDDQELEPIRRLLIERTEGILSAATAAVIGKDIPLWEAWVLRVLGEISSRHPLAVPVNAPSGGG